MMRMQNNENCSHKACKIDLMNLTSSESVFTFAFNMTCCSSNRKNHCMHANELNTEHMWEVFFRLAGEKALNCSFAVEKHSLKSTMVAKRTEKEFPSFHNALGPVLAGSSFSKKIYFHGKSIKFLIFSQLLNFSEIYLFMEFSLKAPTN